MSDATLTREQVADLLKSNFDGAPAVFFSDPARMRALCQKALEGFDKPGIWFNKGRDSVLRRNESGCCCKIDEDGETILSPCDAHKLWAETKARE